MVRGITQNVHNASRLICNLSLLTFRLNSWEIVRLGMENLRRWGLPHLSMLFSLPQANAQLSLLTSSVHLSGPRGYPTLKQSTLLSSVGFLIGPFRKASWKCSYDICSITRLRFRPTVGGRFESESTGRFHPALDIDLWQPIAGADTDDPVPQQMRSSSEKAETRCQSRTVFAQLWGQAERCDVCR